MSIQRLASLRRLFLLVTLVLASGVASAGAADPPPSRPGNLQVTGVTHFSVGLSWSASTDDSNSFSYWISCSNHYWMQVPQSATNATFTTALYPGVTYSFYVVAIDAAGNRSKNSNTVTVSLPGDTIAPSAPAVTVTDVGPTHVSLAWSSTDDGPHVVYSVFKDGVRVLQDTSATSGTFNVLQPNTSYTFTVTARDLGRNLSPPSDPVTVTTGSIDTSDVTPPTSPTNVFAESYGDTEMNVTWTQSTDDVDVQAAITYEIYVNGELSDITIGRGTSINYGVFGDNTISVIAIDTAGNESAPATIQLQI
jgi:hypothetical protein